MAMLDALRIRERNSDVGKGPPDVAAITSLLGHKRCPTTAPAPTARPSQLADCGGSGCSGSRYVSKVKGASDLYFKDELQVEPSLACREAVASC